MQQDRRLPSYWAWSQSLSWACCVLLLSLWALADCASAKLVHSRQKLNATYWLARAQKRYADDGVNVPADCDALYGLGYVQQWKANEVQLCASDHTALTCYQHPPKPKQGGQQGRHPSFTGGRFCYARGLVMDSSTFAGTITPRKGSARIGCKLRDPLPWTDEEMQDQQLDRWLKYAMQPSGAAPGACPSSAAAVVDQPTLFISRVDGTNVFHHFEDVVNTFVELLLFPKPELLQEGLQVVFTDGGAPGFYMELWRRIAYPAKVKFIDKSSFADGTCFSHAILAARPVGVSLYTYQGVGGRTTCRSLVFDAVTDWVHYLVRDTRPEFYTNPDHQHKQNPDAVVGRVLWLSRAHFEAQRMHQLTPWQKNRRLPREILMKQQLHKAVEVWNTASCLNMPPDAQQCRKIPVYFEFMSIEPSNRRWYPEQLFMYSRTNVLIGVHGAGLMNLIFLPKNAASVIEITHNSHGSNHYHNLAHMLGIQYKAVQKADVDDVHDELLLVLDELALRVHAEHKKWVEQVQNGTALASH